MKNNRQYYLDNIRWFTVVLVVIYHVPYAFNNVGIRGIGPDKCFEPMNDFMSIVYPWFMMILFAIAGMSARYLLTKEGMTAKQFIKSKTDKLLVPSTLGLFIIHPITGYLNIMLGGGLEYIPSFILPVIVLLSGSGVLWFVQMLYLFSVLLILVRKLDKQDKLWETCKKTSMLILLVLVFLVWGAAQVLNMPLLTMYRFGVYFVCYMLGYFVLSHEEVTDKLVKYHIPLMIVAIIMGVVFTVQHHGKEVIAGAVLEEFFTNAYAWIIILAMLGVGKAYFNKTGKVSNYMTRHSYGMYVLHFPILMAVGYYLYAFTLINGLLLYLLVFIAEFAGSILLYEITSRIPVVRYLLFGIRKK